METNGICMIPIKKKVSLLSKEEERVTSDQLTSPKEPQVLFTHQNTPNRQQKEDLK